MVSIFAKGKVRLARDVEDQKRMALLFMNVNLVGSCAKLPRF
jgi:hypothetical protein